MNTRSDSAKAFLDLLNKADSVAEVASKLGVSVSTARTRASKYRTQLARKGVQLKRFARATGFGAIDWDEIAQYARTSGVATPVGEVATPAAKRGRPRKDAKR